MHRAGFTKTRFHPPLQNYAKADNQKRWKSAPHGVLQHVANSALFYVKYYWTIFFGYSLFNNVLILVMNTMKVTIIFITK
jgi:hypothetical protein